MDSRSETSPPELFFGEFRLSPARRRLTRGEDVLRLEGRAFDLLRALACNAGRVVTKDELTRAVWPDLHVSDGSLRVHLVEVRKVLGDAPGGGDFITTVRGRGYSFVFPVTHSAVGRSKPALKVRRGIGPRPLGGPVFGRTELSMQISSALDASSLVTLVGPGGIGKTTAAQLAITELSEQFDEIFFVDLSALEDPSQTLDTIAGSIGLAERGVGVDYIASALSAGRPMLFLDGCEHLTPYLAPALSALAKAAPALRCLSTSREPMGISGEQVLRLPPLDLPRPNGSTEEAVGASSVQLLIERIRSAGSSVDLDHETLQLAARVCIAVDGIPLAIELVASNAAALGLEAVASALAGDPLFRSGSGPGLSHRSSLLRTLEWSYQLLSPDEAAAFRRLAICSGDFPLDLAIGLLSDVASNSFVAGLMVRRLVSKSLVAESHGATGPTYRLLDTTRAFGREKLAENRETRATWVRLAKELERRLAVIRSKVETFQKPLGLEGLRSCTNDVRGCLAWCFGQDGDRVLGMELAAAAASFFEELALLPDLERWSRTAISQFSSVPTAPLTEARLRSYLGAAIFLASGRFDEATTELTRGLRTGESVGDVYLTVRCLFWLTLLENGRGNYTEALEYAVRARSASAGIDDPTLGAIVESCVVWVLHWSGEQGRAYETGGAFLDRPNPEGLKSMSRAAQSAYLRARSAWARTLWLVGLPEQATKATASLGEELDRADDPSAVAITLISLASVHGWVGDQQASYACADRAFTLAGRFGLSPHLAVGDALRGLILVKTGEPDKGVPLIENALERMQAGGYGAQTTFLRADLADGLARQGHFDRAVALIEAVTAPLEVGEVTMASPEIYRVMGTILELVPGSHDHHVIEAYERSLNWAKRQSALGWTLKTSLTYAAFLISRERPEDALRIIKAPYDLYKEGLTTRDLVAAKALIDELDKAANLNAAVEGSSARSELTR